MKKMLFAALIGALVLVFGSCASKAAVTEQETVETEVQVEAEVETEAEAE
jgi:PBP1b-binding outer membrane lipoprotein LpoB